MKKHNELRMISEGAIFVALASVLSLIKFWEMPWGGSVELAMIPMVIFCVRWGVGPGFIATFAFSVVQLFIGGGFAINWISIIGDYIVAYTLYGLAGLFHGKKSGVFWGTLLASLGRFAAVYLTGATIWAEYMPETFFGMTMTTPWFYSFLYNIAYVGINAVIALVVFGVLYVPLKKYFMGEDLK